MGRIKRKAGLAGVKAAAVEHPRARCTLCRRMLGHRTEAHHVVPKSRGGRATVLLHPICHRTIHAFASNRQLERDYPTIEAIRAHPEVARFLAWVADKPPNFHVPTRAKK